MATSEPKSVGNGLTFENIKRALKATGPDTSGWLTAKCPAHDDHSPSLRFKNGDKGSIAFKCHAGCDYRAVVNAVERLVGKAAPAKKTARTSGESWGFLPFQRYAHLKQLNTFFLTFFYKVGEGNHRGRPALFIPYFDEDGNICGIKVRKTQSSHDTEWLHYKKATLYGLPTLKLLHARAGWNLDRIVICEGESDTQTLVYNGIPALGVSGKNGWKQEYAQVGILRDAKEIIVIQEPDAEDFAKKVTESFADGKVVTLRLPVKDPSDLWLQNPDQRAFGEQWELLTTAVLKSPYVLQSMTDFTMKPIKWLWRDRIARGKLTMWGGSPGCGKSLAALSLVSIVTAEKEFPDGLNENEAMSVLLFASEDDIEDTIKPRLIAAGADERRVHVLKISCSADDAREVRHLAFDRDMRTLARALRENPAIKLVIVDPLASFIGKIALNKEEEVRSVLEPLQQLAGELDISIVLITHFNKRSDVNALNKILGATAMVGVARATWLFAQDKEAEEEGTERYLMVLGKTNISKKTEGLTYTIEQKDVTETIREVPYVVWGEATSISADKALDSFGLIGDVKETKTRKAEKWLAEFLGDESKPQADIEAAAEAAGHSMPTLRIAKKHLGVDSKKVRGGQWCWSMSKD